MSSKTKTYTKLTDIEHVLKRPGMYIGSVVNKNSEEFVYDKTINKIVQKNVYCNDGIVRIFIEAISNAIDNIADSEDEGIKCTYIKICIDKENGKLSVKNDGAVIPVEYNEEYKMYNHRLLFGETKSGSNYDDTKQRKKIGLNGLGVKLTNIMSSYFKVRGVDTDNKLSYEKTWSNNMKNSTKEKIAESKLKKGYTLVEWIPDYERFNFDGMTDDLELILTKIVYDVVACCSYKVNIFLNDEKIEKMNLLDYSRLYDSRDDNEEENSDEEDNKIKEEYIFIKSKNYNLVIKSSPDCNYRHFSFVNGLHTKNGGVHVKAVEDVLFKGIVAKANTKETEKNGTKFRINDVKNFFTIFLSVDVDKPEFESQSKHSLESPSIDINIDQKQINAIFKWDSVQENINRLKTAKELSVLKKNQGKKRGQENIPEHDKANLWGTKQSTECILILCEGLSAKGYAIVGIDSGAFGKKGRDYFGILPLKGKLLNVRNATVAAISKNKEIGNIVKSIGLRYDVDYTLDENFKTLKYGNVMLLCDADDDGKHINSLIMNFFHYLFPSLLKRKEPFILSNATPLVRVKTAKGYKDFFNLYSFKDYVAKQEGKKINFRYYKGLGTYDDNEVVKFFGKRVIYYNSDSDVDENMVNLFGKKNTAYRKDWLKKFDPDTDYIKFDKQENNVNISDYLNKELIHFSIDDCSRSIPNLMDGLKESQRKILYSCFLKKCKTKLIKVAQLGGFVSEKTAYIHGEKSLYECIIGLAQNHMGSNNIPLLDRKGQTGSRIHNGKDAASERYVYTRLDKYTRLLFNEKDDHIINYKEDDGCCIEPYFYVPIIPMILVNGSKGIGTGWSTSIPCYNPLDVVTLVREWLQEKRDLYSVSEDGTSLSEYTEIIPYYNNFTGEITELSPGKYQTTGIIENMKSKTIVKELPITMSTQSFKEFLDKMQETKVIKKYKNNSKKEKIHFTIFEDPNGLKCSIENLKLKTYLHTTNLVLFDENGKLKKFSCVEEIVDHFCKVRFEYYKLRRQYNIDNIKFDLKILENKKRFFEELETDQLVIKKKTKKQISEILEKRGYDKFSSQTFKSNLTVENMNEEDDEEDEGEEGENKSKKIVKEYPEGYKYLLSMSIINVSVESIRKLQEKIDKKIKELEIAEKTKPEDLWNEDLDKFVNKYKP